MQSTSKTVAIVTNSTWNIYNFRLSLIKKLKSNGFRVIVIAPVDEYIHYLNESYFTRHIPLKSLAPQSKNPLRDLFLTWELFKIYKKEKPDLILHYTIKPNIYGSLAARMAGILSISTVTGLGYTFLSENLTNKLVEKLYRFAFQKVRKIIFHNNDDRLLFLNKALVKSEQSMVIRGSGVNTNYFRPLSVVPRREKFIFLFIGRLLYDKGILEFVEAAQQLRKILKDAEFWVVGQFNAENPSTVAKEKLLEWVEARDIHYLGATKDVRKYIKKATAIVLPSYREGIPRAILEGMAMGKPVITTDTPGCRETVDEKINGFIVPEKDTVALARAMHKMYNLDIKKLGAMGESSREMALENFDEKIIIEKYFQLIQKATKTHLVAAPVLSTNPSEV